MSGDDLRIGEWVIPGAELEERFDTSGGPGGQHANRTQSAVTLRLDVSASSLPEEARAKLVARLGTTVEVVASESRSQWRNRSIARKLLTEKLEEALVDPAVRRPTRPTRASKEKRLQEKKARSKIKRDRRPPEIE